MATIRKVFDLLALCTVEVCVCGDPRHEMVAALPRDGWPGIPYQVSVPRLQDWVRHFVCAAGPVTDKVRISGGDIWHIKRLSIISGARRRRPKASTPNACFGAAHKCECEPFTQRAFFSAGVSSLRSFKATLSAASTFNSVKGACALLKLASTPEIASGTESDISFWSGVVGSTLTLFDRIVSQRITRAATAALILLKKAALYEISDVAQSRVRRTFLDNSPF
jgi:hypothetical protein